MNFSLIECTRCVLDSNDDPNLLLNENGICNHCLIFEKEWKQYVPKREEGKLVLDKMIKKIKSFGQGKKYDCLIGLSGGVDSSYVAYLGKKFGLRPLAVHFDNGWNTELAVQNIENIVNILGFDLHTYVIDWEEFKDLQLAYLKASVIDIEVLTDHAIYGTLFNIAKKNNIKYVLGGLNMATEGILPYHWTYNKKDFINIKDIHKKYGKKKLKTYPFLTRKIKRNLINSEIEFVNYLNLLPFQKDEVKKVLMKEVNWRDYGGKHQESIFTRFYQGYILPKKFGVDKRKAHLSSLICSGQITKTKALKILNEPIYNAQQLEEDLGFVLKKLGLSLKDFNHIMELPPRSHKDFAIEGSLFYYYPILLPLRPLWIMVRNKLGIRQRYQHV